MEKNMTKTRTENLFLMHRLLTMKWQTNTKQL